MKKRGRNGQKGSSGRTDIPPADLPLFCDFTCRFADFAQPDSVGACHREQAVFCTLLNRYHNKHAGCLVRHQHSNET